MTNSLSQDIGIRIRNYRKLREMTQEDLAQQANLDVTYISQLENGRKSSPTLDTLSRILGALNVSFEELFHGIQIGDSTDKTLTEIITIVQGLSERQREIVLQTLTYMISFHD